jgi:hypothetical protein
MNRGAAAAGAVQNQHCIAHQAALDRAAVAERAEVDAQLGSRDSPDGELKIIQ